MIIGVLGVSPLNPGQQVGDKANMAVVPLVLGLQQQRTGVQMTADAVPPTGSPEPTPADLAYANMEFEWQRAIVRPLAGKLGLPPGTVLFTLALFASLPLGAAFQFVPGAAAKNLYGLVAGEEEGTRGRGGGAGRKP